MLLDTDVMVDILRQFPPAVAWFAGDLQASAALPGLVAMELIQGCSSLAAQTRLESQLARFVWHWPTPADCDLAYQEFASNHLGHGLGMIDALIAATAIGLGETLATFNLKHYGIIKGLHTIQPY